MLARDFPSIEAVPDATFGEFQEVRLPEPRTPPPPPPPPRRPSLPSPTPRRPPSPSPTQTRRPPTSPTQRRPPPPSPTQRRPPPPSSPQTSPAPFTNFGATPTPTPAPGRFPGSAGGVTGGVSGLNILLTEGERREILDKLLGRDINSIVLTPLQRLAVLQENQARQSRNRPGPVGPSETPRVKPTTRRPQAPRRTSPAFRPAAIRQENFQTTFRPRLQTTARPGVAFQTNFERQEEEGLSDNDENFDYIEDNEVSSKSMVEQAFSLFENFSNRKNGGKTKNKPVSPFKRPSLRFLPDPPTKPPTTRRPPPTPPTRPPTQPPPPPPPPPPPAAPAAPQRQVAKRVRIKLGRGRQNSEVERPRNFNNFPARQEIQDKSAVRARLTFLPENTRPQQRQIQRTTARPQSFQAVPRQQTPLLPRPTPATSGLPRPPPSNSLSSRPPPSNSRGPLPTPSNSRVPRPPSSNSLGPLAPPSNSVNQVKSLFMLSQDIHDVITLLSSLILPDLLRSGAHIRVQSRQ